MKKTAKAVMVVFIGLALMVPAAFAAEPKYSGFLGEY